MSTPAERVAERLLFQSLEEGRVTIHRKSSPPEKYVKGGNNKLGYFSTLRGKMAGRKNADKNGMRTFSEKQRKKLNGKKSKRI